MLLLLPYTTHPEHERDYLFRPEAAEKFKKESERYDICHQGQLDAGKKTIQAVREKFIQKIDALISELRKKDYQEKQEYPHPLIGEVIFLRQTVLHILEKQDDTSLGKIRIQHITDPRDNTEKGYLTIKMPIVETTPLSKYKSNHEINTEISPELAGVLIPRITPENQKRKAEKYNYGVTKKRYYKGDWRLAEFIYPAPIDESYYTAEVESKDQAIVHDLIEGVGPEITFDSNIDFFSQGELQIMNRLSKKKYKQYSKALRWNRWKSMMSDLLNKKPVNKATLQSDVSSQNLTPHE